EASNLAWQTGKGEFLARMDADDEALPDRLHLQVSFLDENPDLAACATQVRIRKRLENGRVVAPDGGYARYEDWINSVISPEHISRERFVDSPFPNPTAMIRRSVMEQVGGYADPSWAEDYDLWLRVLEKGHRLGKVERPLLDWIDAPMRSTRTVERYQLSRFQEAKAHYLSHFESVKEKGVVIAGAGPIGKEMNRLLEAEEITRHAFLEVNARQVGNKAGGIPILGSEEIAGFQSEAILIGALGQPGARARLQKLACETGFTEGVDFFCVA
ncbi:MAG: glycosyltransferase, partial [Verrucomicrobiota bacterium]